ncbi:MAG: alanine--tRNA ligase [Candidatus Wallbacteria bacterium]|nr:alanine--tRNA ligase [Candidatus Wallbacteria bacterium]
MKSSEIRTQFIRYFEERGHRFVPSSPVVPVDDPTLFFTNAGMNQFKDVFLGLGKRDYTRAVNSQKCMRVSGKHNDLEEVGKDGRHHTLFEMLGNWSFGDYYKQESIAWGWDLLTRVWGLPKERLWVTIYKSDDEAGDIWHQAAGLPRERILKFAEKDNFWEMGDTGPCGPCSEIHYDYGVCDLTPAGAAPDHECAVNGVCGRYTEIWNHVFIQYNRGEDGKLTELPAKHVDTGMGFERISTILEGKRSNYDTDLFVPILEATARLSGRVYTPGLESPRTPHTPEEKDSMAFRVIADHVRALSFTITDGAIPSNEGRGYVMRRILRRACRYGRNLGMDRPFLHELVGVVAETMGGAFPELREKAVYAAGIVKSEEERFLRTLDIGLEKFSQALARTRARGDKAISGEDAFRLYDTYGFPIDLTQLMAAEEEVAVDLEGFQREMGQQKERARAGKAFVMDVSLEREVEGLAATRFTGYETLGQASRILRWMPQGEEQGAVVLAETPFYAEAGGQVGDRGTIEGPGLLFRVDKTVKAGEVHLHLGTVESGVPHDGMDVRAQVDLEARAATAKNHTATHLLHAALRQILGTHVQQAGSLVGPDRLRFDFTHPKALTAQEMLAIEHIVNAKVREAIPVSKKEMGFDEAKKSGAMALFGEKYGDRVRVISVPGFSTELCGGTHLENTHEVVYFKVVSESSVAANVRRLECLTADGALKLLEDYEDILERSAAQLKTTPLELEARLAQLVEENRRLARELDSARKKMALSSLDDLAASAASLEGLEGKLLAHALEGIDVANLRDMADKLDKKLAPAVVVLASVSGDKANFVCKVSKALVDRGLDARQIVSKVAAIAGGGGGGRPDMATAGAKEPGKVPEAIRAAREIVLGSAR